MKVIGLMTAWNAEDWIVPALKQAVTYCDEVLCWIAPHSIAMKKYEDRTSDKAHKFEEYYLSERHMYKYRCKNLKIIDGMLEGYGVHSVEKANILNTMLESYSAYFDVGNWIWILDVDEFYPKELVDVIYTEMMSSGMNVIEVSEIFFYINMKYYLKGSHYRFFKIEDFNMRDDRRFYPTQRWFQPYQLLWATTDFAPMFHYSMLMNPFAKLDFWKNEYPNNPQTKKTRWMEEIYKNFDLNNQNYWIRKNFELCGIKSPWFANDFRPNEGGHLYQYNEGKHPKFIEETDLVNIEDFRRIYGF